MAAGIQPDDGTFDRKTFDEIEADILDTARAELGQNADLSQGSPLKQLVDIEIFESEHFWEVMEGVYYAAYYEDAWGEQLDKVLSLASMDRIPRRGATGEVSFSTKIAPASDVTIPQGTRVSTKPTEDRPAIPFKTTKPATLEAGDDEVVGVPIKALEPWETDLSTEWLGKQTNVAAETIRVINTPVPAVDSVTNPYPTGASSAHFNYISGRDRETDAEFRQRYEESLGEAGSASLDAIRASIRQLPDVDAVYMEENTSMVDKTGSGGLPPKSVRPTVLHSGSRNEIAEAIVQTRAAGIESYGEVSGVATTSDGVLRTEHFDEADDVVIYVEANVEHDDSYPDDGNKQVENAIIEYVGGETVDGDTYDGTDMGTDVMYDLVFKAAMSVDGVYSADVYIDTTTAPAATSDIAIAEKEVARTAPGAITVFDTQGTIP